MPVLAIFFPLQIAVGATAIIHLANNLFKVVLVGKYADSKTVIQFGIPAAIAAIIGAYLLSFLSTWQPLFSYHLFSLECSITIIGIIVGSLVVLASLFELIPKFSSLSFSPTFIPVGGFLSGFFGGISGNQGILRSAFLIKSGLNKEAFIGTGVFCSVIVDSTRLFVYGWAIYTQKFTEMLSQNMTGILVAASIAAFLGSYIGSILTHKITITLFQIIVGSMLLILGIAIMAGVAKT